MKIYEKLSKLKKTIQQIKKISQNSNNDNVFEAKIIELNKEIMILKEGISENVKELEKMTFKCDNHWNSYGHSYVSNLIFENIYR